MSGQNEILKETEAPNHHRDGLSYEEKKLEIAKRSEISAEKRASQRFLERQQLAMMQIMNNAAFRGRAARRKVKEDGNKVRPCPSKSVDVGRSPLDEAIP